MVNIQCQYGIRDRSLRLARLSLLLLVFLLSFKLYYPDFDYSLASAGAEIFWALMQVIDMDCGSSPEINLITHACLDISVASVSLGMMLQLSFCITRRGLNSIYYWWTMISWGGLAIVNVFLSYHTIMLFSKRRWGRKLKPQIMFNASGDPVAVAFSPNNSINLTNMR